ncbi:MAG: amidase family protein, partial [Acidimicrobiales bacterium]
SGAGDLWLDVEDGMFPERAAEFTSIVRVGLERSQDVTMPRFARRLRWRKRLEQEVAALFRDVDVLVTPATAAPAFAAEGPLPTVIAGEEVAPGMVVPFTMLANLCWNPAVSVPAGTTSDKLPVGLQIVGRRHADDVVLRLARILEQVHPWPRHAPAPN